jgi:TatD DNase family protein
MMNFTDTHCHIHDPEFFPDGGDEPYRDALSKGVLRQFCVGTDINSSKKAVGFCTERDGAFAVVGIHPHDAKKDLPETALFFEWCAEQKGQKLVGVGEIGLDYYYDNSPREQQVELLEKQIDLALQLGLPISFHVRNAFDDFWPIFDNFSGIRGVLHSFTDTTQTMEKGLERGLYVGVNGIATFARDRDEVTKAIPLDKLLFETDAPFLTPVPLRGKVNVPGNVPLIASYVAELRGATVEELSQRTEQNVTRLFF